MFQSTLRPIAAGVAGATPGVRNASQLKERHARLSRQFGGAVGVAITGSLAAAIYRHGLSLSEFSLTASQQSAVTRSLSGVIALNGKLDAATASRFDHMADGMLVKGVALAMAFSALVTLFVAGITFIALRQRPNQSASAVAQPCLGVE